MSSTATEHHYMAMLQKHVGDLFSAIDYCYQNALYMPCLVLLYSGIDVAASLEPSTGKGVRQRFENWVQRYMLDTRSLPCTATELYAARCAIVHTYTPDSDISQKGKARVVAYAFGSADVKELDEATARTQRDKLQVNVHLRELIDAFRDGYKTYLNEALADATRRKEVIEHANNWTVSIDVDKVQQFLALNVSLINRADS